jgi:hypothetical protein
MKNILLFSGLIFLTTSCFTHRGLNNNSDYQVVQFSKDSLTGLYENAIPDDPDNSLWEDLYKNKSHKELIFNTERTQVELVLVSEKLLKVNLYRRGTLEDSMDLKGKIKNGYFVINRRVSTFPLPIFFVYAENKTIVGNDDQGNLVLVQGQMNEYVVLLSVFGGNSDVISARYARL